jgi:hypothetical protein
MFDKRFDDLIARYFREPTPAPVELCEDIRTELTAAWNILGKALYRFDAGPDRRDVVNHRRRIKELIATLESQHTRTTSQRLRTRGER